MIYSDALIRESCTDNALKMFFVRTYGITSELRDLFYGKQPALQQEYNRRN